MSEIRKTLSLRIGTKPPEDREAEAAALIRQAIDEGSCLRWTYNRVLMRAEPRILYRRNGGLYVDAVVIEKNGAPPAELKIGSFKLTGLGNPVPTGEPIASGLAVDLADPRYAEGIVARGESRVASA